MKKLHTEGPQQARESNLQPSRCEATALTTVTTATMEILKKKNKSGNL